MVPGNTSPIQPSSDNFYLVDFEDVMELETYCSPQQLCIQQLRTQVAKPFIPCCRDNTIALFQKAVPANDCHHHFSQSDPAKSIFAALPLRDLLSFSSTCKLYYLAIRSISIWEIKLKYLLPSITYLKGSPLNPEQQFLIVFRKIATEKRVYSQLLRSYEKYLEESIKPAWFIADQLEEPLIKLVGSNYDGKYESIAQDSQMGRCIAACELIPKEFDKQETFERLIKAAEKAYAFESKNLFR